MCDFTKADKLMNLYSWEGEAEKIINVWVSISLAKKVKLRVVS